MSLRRAKGWTVHELRQAIGGGDAIAVRVDGEYRFPTEQFSATKQFSATRSVTPR